MSEIKKNGNSTEQVLYREKIHEPLRQAQGFALVGLPVLIFFLLPAFARLQTKGLLLWASLCIAYALYAYSCSQRDFVYTLTAAQLRKNGAAGGTVLWKVNISEIRDIHMSGSYLHITIPKKRYSIYTNTTSPSLYTNLARLRNKPVNGHQQY